MWIFPNWKRSAFGLNFPAHVASYKTGHCFPQHYCKDHPSTAQGKEPWATGVQATSWSPQKAWGTCTKGPMSLKNVANHPEPGQSAVPPPCFLSQETRELIVYVSGSAGNGSLTPPTTGIALRGLVVVGWCWWGRNTQPWTSAMKHLSPPWRQKSQIVCLRSSLRDISRIWEGSCTGSKASLHASE